MAEEPDLVTSGGSEHSSAQNTTTKGKQDLDHGNDAAASPAAKKPSKFKQLWNKTGLDTFTILLMFKGSLPPTIGIAAFQSTRWATQYSTIGYLVAIISVLAMAIMPRAKFLQTLALNLISTCLAASVNLLALYCAVQARLHTTPAGAPITGYNSSASAVLAVWFIFQLYLINALRAARPAFQFPVILYSIFVCVSLTYGTQFPTMASAISFMDRLLEAFLTGFAISTGVSLFIIPVNSRTVIFKQMTGYYMLMGGMLKAQTAYMASLEELTPEVAKSNHDQEMARDKHSKEHKRQSLLMTPQADALKELHGKLYELHGKIQGDIPFAKREIAIGKLGASDLSQIWKLARLLMVPITGLASSIDILQRRSVLHGWFDENPTEAERETHHRQIENLHYMMRSVHGPFASMSAYVNEAIQHSLITLELVKPPKQKSDVESNGDNPRPGSPGFAAVHKKNVDEFYELRKQTLRDWCASHGIDLPANFFDPSFVMPENAEHAKIPSARERDSYQRQVFVILFLEHLLWRAGAASLDLVLYADEKKQSGVLNKKRLIFPGGKTIKKWVTSVFGHEDISTEDHYTSELDAGGNESLDLGGSFAKKKDPEHLPPRNTLEKTGEIFRLIPKFLRSDASAFGLRVAAATMTIGIVCFLEASQIWFLQNRLLWAMIMVAISMSRTAGQSIFNFVLRVLGTLVAMIGSYVVWYIVDGHTAGVIVFLWLWIFSAFYIILKFPKLIIVGLLGLVTTVLIIGYELQVKKIGKVASESNGQPSYPTYELAPYRLATVAGGLLVAFIWTIFPFPISESTEIRKDLGSSLYLLANFYSIQGESIRSRVRGNYGDAEVKGHRAYHLEKARTAVFNKLIFLFTQMRQNSAFSKFQVRFGGRFPREEYESLIEAVGRVLRNTALLGYAARAFSHTSPDSPWSQDFRKLLTQVNANSHQLTSLLSLLSSSLLHGRPLPPYLQVPQPQKFAKRLQSIDHDILSVRHIAEPEYAAFAIMQIAAQSIHDDVTQITHHVKTLVGEIDFSFHVISTSQDISESDLSDSEDEKKVHDAV